MHNLVELIQWVKTNRPTLFLDRDGVINKRLPGRYVQQVEEFHFYPNLSEHWSTLNQYFQLVVVVTNQQGIGKQLMSHEDLAVVHEYMLFEIEMSGGAIDEIYYCPDLADHNPVCRKPNPGMALEAQADFPDIQFKNALMVGDSISDIQFGQQLGMKTLLISTKKGELQRLEEQGVIPNATLDSLMDFIRHLQA